MRALTTIAVLQPKTWEQLYARAGLTAWGGVRRCAKSPRLTSVTRLRQIETRLFALAADDEPDPPLAHFQVILDGWNTTPVSLRGWVEQCYPRLASAWRSYCRSGVLVLRGETRLKLKPPSCRELKLGIRQCGLGGYAAELFIKALFDSIRFANATKGLAVVVTRVVGVSRGDAEYQVSAEMAGPACGQMT
jgi:hypothetical protein